MLKDRNQHIIIIKEYGDDGSPINEPIKIIQKQEEEMPTISMFYGIIVRMYRELGGKHHIPHIHVLYGENEAIFDFDGNIVR